MRSYYSNAITLCRSIRWDRFLLSVLNFDVSIDSLISRAQLCCCDGNGKLTIFDLEEKQAVMNLNVPIQRTHRGRITALSYSPCGMINITMWTWKSEQNLSSRVVSGTFLVGGAENGYIWVINPATMIISEDSPLQYSDEKIRLLVFSPDSKFIVFTVKFYLAFCSVLLCWNCIFFPGWWMLCRLIITRKR